MAATQFLFLLFIVAIVCGSGLFLLIEIYAVIIGHLKGAPYIPSNKKKVAAMIELAACKPGETALDLGSGNGVLLRAAAARGARGIGIEINPFLCSYSRLLNHRAGLAHSIRIQREDLRTYDVGEADVIFMYLWPSTIDALKQKLVREAKLGARIISNAFPIVGWTPVREKEGVYEYHIVARYA